MNLIVCCAIYKGDAVTERGLRTMSFQIPGTGKKPLNIPISLLPSYAAGETTAPSVFAEDTNILNQWSYSILNKMAPCMLSLHNL